MTRDRSTPSLASEQSVRSDGHAASAGGGFDVTIQDVLGIVIRQRKLVIGIAVMCIAAGLLFAVNRDRHYVANTRILIYPNGVQVLDRDVIRPSESSEGGVAVVESQMRVLTSESVLKDVVSRENLIADSEFVGEGGGLLSEIRGLFASRSAGGPDPSIKALFKLEKAVSTSRPQRSHVIDLYVKTRDAAKSARLANTIAQTYIDLETESRSRIARQASGTLSARLSELRDELTAAENAIEQYKLANNILDSNGSPINEQELEQLNRQLVDARARTALARSALEQIRRARQTTSDLDNIPEALGSSTISGLRIRLATALQRRSVLAADLLPSHPNMAAVDAEVAVVQQQIAQELTRIVGRAEADLDRALTEQERIEERLEAIKQSTFVTNDARVRLRELTRDASARRDVYQTFLLRSKELGEQENVNTMQARIISAAIPPLRPSGLGSVLILAFAGIVGVGLGICTALVRGFLSAGSAAGQPARPAAEPARPVAAPARHRPSSEPARPDRLAPVEQPIASRLAPIAPPARSRRVRATRAPMRRTG
ncbi:MAG: GNVR domain-containing protein [Pseudomonadota bacterium]